MASNNIKVAINGFGRIGRSFFRLCLEQKNIKVVAINDPADTKTLAHLLKYDSIHGVLNESVEYHNDTIICDQQKVLVSHEIKLENINWQFAQPDFVLESSGKFKTSNQLQNHIKNGAKRCILSVPPQDDQIKMVVLGVNESILKADDKIISNASCTTNNAAPMLNVMHQALGVQQAYISTIHSYTTDQSLHDSPHKDLRRARAATQSIVPTTTGAAKALTKIFPDLSHAIGGCGIRVPVPNGSLTDMTLYTKQKTNQHEVNQLFKEAAQRSPWKILRYCDDPIVSIDIKNSPYSCIFDSEMTSVIDGNLIKLLGWYDNERGYSNRLIDLMLKMHSF
ncbi:MAG: type I glyceraldehyde-3-phosphate dehydrogenase [Psychroflexus sp.]|nr:type I glyceraldehyde-3-phosphate dehydrogenase [Psychroflexus sp.]MDR9448231.1 type I glyceraldehyde-3-phosphate dehydrogenase [Psychroflexus sp.]